MGHLFSYNTAHASAWLQNWVWVICSLIIQHVHQLDCVIDEIAHQLVLKKVLFCNQENRVSRGHVLEHLESSQLYYIFKNRPIVRKLYEWENRDRNTETETQGWKHRDGNRETETQGWKQRDRNTGMETERQKHRDGNRETETQGWKQRDRNTGMETERQKHGMETEWQKHRTSRWISRFNSHFLMVESAS